MSKRKFIILFLFSILCLCSPMVSHAETTLLSNYEVISDLVIVDNENGILYEFYSEEYRDDFLASNSKYQTRSNGVADTKRVFVRSIPKTYTSGAISINAYGGEAGATLTPPVSYSFADPKTGHEVTVSLGVSHNVPPYTYGHIIVKANYNLNEYDLKVRYLGTNKYVNAGKTYTISNAIGWTELRTWK
ncbi:hypothetical protein [Streptococcus suis]|uniref:hypothetical protein n=1 Tax=Streptococcus suis TaxID=1307 RepID=UPI000F6366A6|nr:hypothetical protein [Streptococcus suis]MBM7138359.1 hypothetical protein [Streptococcus suis]MBY4601375.1 hypothetical protein [Streptococcus suis]MCO8172849.1 hypothetical protein [Streptococcus suis]MCO8181233.1 hypothetical protein [Streptococcus suis]MCO8191368.1 hypothetical protein [Streptococcus suis]